MAKKRGRGGYRKPTPTRKNAVSGPGALSQRTDGAQPVMRLPDAKYGESKSFEEQQQAAPLPKDTLPTAPGRPAQAMPEIDVFSSTARPTEPVTSGLPFGPGLGPEQTQDVNQLLYEVYALTNDPAVLNLMNQ